MRQAAAGPVFECGPLARVAAHCFTARPADARPDREGSERVWAGLAEELGVSQIHRLRQVHGVGVARFLRGADAKGVGRSPLEADIAISNDPAAAIAVQVADCVPLLLADERSGAVGAVHAGWRGTAAGAVEAAVRAMGDTFGSAPRDLIAAIGPSIGPCCYEVGEEVRAAFLDIHPAARVDGWFSSHDGGRPRLDLWAATSDQLEACGIPADRIHVAALCTALHPEWFYSYRREGPVTGRLVGVIRARDS